MMLPIHTQRKFRTMRERLAGLRRDARLCRVQPERITIGRGPDSSLRVRRPLRVAYHEAAHAVVSLKLGMCCPTVRCDPHGMVTAMRGEYPYLVSLLVYTMAAKYAEKRRAPLFAEACEAGLGDEAWNRLVLVDMSPKRRGRRLIRERAELATRGMVARHWREIDKLARELYKRGFMRLTPLPLRLK